MDKKELQKLMKQKESSGLEFKQSLSNLDRIVEVVCSLANTKGGFIIIGVSDKGIVKGIDIGKQTVEGLTNKIVDNTDQSIYPTITVESIDKKKIISIKVEQNPNKPHTAFGRPFIRIGKNTKLMKQSEYEQQLLKRKPVVFDGQVCESASLKYIDETKIKSFKSQYKRLTGKGIQAKSKVLLENLGCIKKNNVTNAGILLFGKNSEKYFINAYIAIARYKGKNIGAEKLDYKEFHGTLFDQIDAADKYIQEHIAMMSRLIKGQVQRQDIPEYPLFAIRELIVNAVAHRDYSEQGSKIIIKMFSNRIEYYNPGGLPDDITPKNILKRQKSRNPLIVKTLNKLQYIEELGEGWDRIIEEIKTHPLNPPLPKINNYKNAVLITLYRAELNPFERYKDKLNSRQIKIIRYLKENESTTSAEYSKMFMIVERQARRDLSKLVELNLLVKKGKALSTNYELSPDTSGHVRTSTKEFILKTHKI